MKKENIGRGCFAAFIIMGIIKMVKQIHIISKYDEIIYFTNHQIDAYLYLIGFMGLYLIGIFEKKIIGIFFSLLAIIFLDRFFPPGVIKLLIITLYNVILIKYWKQNISYILG